MKHLRMLAVSAIVAFSTTAMAQVTYGNDYQYSPTSSSIYGSDDESFGLFYAQYSPSQLHSSYKGYSHNTSFNVASLGYSYYISLGDMPLYVAPGIAAQWMFKSTKEGSVEYKTNIVAAKIPVNLMYSIQVSDGFRIEPYAGIYGRINIWGEAKETYEGKSEKWNLFSSDEGEAYKRFQFGWNAGVNFRITNAFTIGGGYYMDLTKIAEHTNFQGFDITLGVNF